MKGRAIVPLVLGLAIGLVAVKFLVNTLQDAKGSPTDQIEMVRATQDIDSYQEITPEMLSVVRTVENSMVSATERIASIEEIVGRVTAKGIPANTTVQWSMIAPVGTPSGMVGRIPPGFRAVSVKIDEVTGVAYQLKPGDWVDVIVVMDVDSGGRGGRKHTVAEVILQHVQVAAIGRSHTGATEETGGTRKPAKSATLLVLEQDVPRLHLAGTRGKITLAMRGSDDRITEVPASAYSDELLNGPKLPTQQTSHLAPPPVADEPFAVTVYRNAALQRGPEVHQVTFASPQSRTVVGVSGAPMSRAPRNRSGSQRNTGTHTPATGTTAPNHNVGPNADNTEDE